MVVGASHAGKLSALLAASLETKFLKLPQQSQTPDAAEDLADELRSMELTGNDVVYLDLLSNQVYLGTDEDGNSSEPFKDNHKKWHISGSLVAAAKPRIRKVLDRLSAIRDACGTAKVICGLPIPRYVEQQCCSADNHINNHSEEEISEVHEAVRVNSKACLMAAYPGCIILDPLRAFKGEADTAVLGDLISSGGVSIWKEGDPVHLTQTAYGDIAEQIVNTVAGRGGEDAAAPARKRLESVVTRSAIVQPQRPVAGWLLGGNQGGARGRGYMHGSANRGGRVARGGPAVMRGGGGDRWAPY